MEFSDEEYPYSRDGLPKSPELLDEVDWDVVCIFDACRWDAFEEVCSSSEPVTSPVTHTFEWIKQVWCNDEYDWSDVTYLSGNLMTTAVEDDEGFSDSIENHVASHMQYFENGDVFDDLLGTTRPRELTTRALHDTDPPFVVHYLQPHSPFIGNIHLNVTSPFDETVLPVTGGKRSREAQLVNEGHVSVEMYRAAYLENLKLVWKESERLRDEYDRVITTADHGEVLGPDEFSHGVNTNQGHVVPFHANWEVELPEPVEVGATETHNWVQKTGSDGPMNCSGSESRDEKLRSLGYRS